MAKLAEGFSGDAPERLFLVGGSWRAIARIDMERRGYPLKVLHEYRMTPKGILDTIKYIGKSDIDELRGKDRHMRRAVFYAPLFRMLPGSLLKVLCAQS